MTHSLEARPEKLEAPATRQIVATPTKGIAVRSAALVRRGLRDLARQSNWLVKKVFEGPVANAAISPDGQICTFSDQVRHGTQRVTLFDVERSLPTMTLNVSDEPAQTAPGLASHFSWSPDARYLIAAWAAWPSPLQLFDLSGKRLVGPLGTLSPVPADVAWSSDGSFAAVSGDISGPELQLWQMPSASVSQEALPPAPLRRLRTPAWIDLQRPEAESSEAGTFSSYGKTAFSPSGNLLATVMQIEGEWADDSILLLDATSLERRGVFTAQGRVTDLVWSHDGNRLVYCSAGQAYGIDPVSAESTSLPFGGEICAWHPHLPVCLFFSSWLRNSAKGRLFLADMNRILVFDEYPAEGVLDLRWSADGSKAYAVTADGLVYLYEPELL